MVFQVIVPAEQCTELAYSNCSDASALFPPTGKMYLIMLSCSDTWPRDKAAVLRFIHISRGHSGA